MLTIFQYGPVKLYRDFVDSGNLTNVSNNGEVLSFTVTIPAGETYKQTFILKVPTDYGKYNNSVSDYEKWEILVRQNLTDTMAYSASSPSSYNRFMWNDENTPANTIVIKDTNIGAMVYHKLRRSYQINKFIAGEEIHKNGNNSNNLGFYGNYYINDVYRITSSSEQYVLYGVSMINDSSEPLDMSKTRVIDTIPNDMEFVGMAQMDSSGLSEQVDARGIKFSYTENVSYGTTESHISSNMIEIRDIDDYSGSYTGGYIFSRAKRDSIGVRGYQKNGNEVEFLFDTEYLMKPYSYTTFYYVCKMKYGSSAGSQVNTISWNFSELMKGMKPTDFSCSSFEILYSKYPINNTTGCSNLLGYCNYSMSEFTLTSTVQQYAESFVKANMYKSVVGNNNYKEIIGEGETPAKLNYYSHNMNQFKLDEDNVVTFAIAVANDSYDVSPSMDLTDKLPKGFEFLGVHTITDEYDIYQGIGKNIKYNYEEKRGITGEYYTGETTKLGAQEHYLSPLITSGTVSGAILNGKNRKHESLITTDRDFAAQEEGMQSGGNYTFEVTGSYETGQNISFDIEQPCRTVTYIIYSCRVHPEYYEKGERVRNNASLNGNIMYWNGMQYAPFYNSDLSNIRLSEEYQNNCKGIYHGPSYMDYQGCSIQAYCYLEAIDPDKSANIQKTVFATYDKDDISKGEAYYETADHQSVRKNNDGTNLSSLIGDIPSKSILHGTANVLKYSPVDGIHATQDYRSSVIWKVTVKNDGKVAFNAADLIEKIDNPFKLYGYTIGVKNKDGELIGAFCLDYNGAKDPDETTVEYTSKVTGQNVTRNVYNINLVTDLNTIVKEENIEGTKENIKNALEEFSDGYTYELYLYTDMAEEYLDWYYDTTILKLEDVYSFTFKNLDDQSIEKDVGIRNDDWVSVIASDGIKYIEKYKEDDEYNINSKNSIIYKTTEENKKVNFTLEMGSYLYQTKYYKNGSLNNIIMYDLLPGIKTGGVGTDEIGGGYTVDTDSFNAYILRTDGEKEVIDKSKYKVMYSLEHLHGGRHPSPINNADDTVYNVDFAKATDEDIWQEDYNKDCRSFRIVFDENIELKNADRLYVDYNVTIRDDALENLEYHNVFGYIYDCICPEDESKNHRLYEDTIDVSILPKQPQEITFKKVLYDINGDIITDVEDYFNKDFTFSIYNAKDDFSGFYANKLGEFKLKPNEKITISEIAEQTGIEFEVGNAYCISESSISNVSFQDAKAYINGKRINENIKVNKDTRFIYFKYEDDDTKPLMIFINNKILSRGRIQISKVDENNKVISFGDGVTVSYKIFDEKGNALKFIKSNDEYNYFYYSQFSGSDVIESEKFYCYLENLPLGTYTIKEIKEPNNYQISEETVEVTCDDMNIKYISIKNKKLDTPVNLTINKIDSSTEELITTGETKFVVRNNYSIPSELINFIDLNKEDEKGHHYRLANEDDNSDDIVNELTTYNSKIYIENIGYNVQNMYFFEISSAFGYGNFSTNYSVASYYSTSSTITEPVVNIRNEEKVRDTIILKKDINDKSILGEVEYEVLLNEEKMKFVKIEDETYSYLSTEYTIPVYEMVAPNYQGDDYVTNISTKNGIVKIKDIPYYINNTYEPFKIRETKAPKGYQLDGELKEIKNLNNKNEYEIFNKPDNGYVQFTKKDDLDNIIEEPVSFEVYNENDEKIYFSVKEKTEEKGNIYEYSSTRENSISEITTDNGKMFINKLPIGNYKLKETRPANGFTMETEYIEFTVEYTNTESTPLKVDVINVHDVGNIVFTKVDTKGEVILDTAKFNIVNANNEMLKFTKQENAYELDENGNTEISTLEGKIVINNLPIGKYKLVEVEAPPTYKIDEPLEFTIKGADYYEAQKVNVVNKHAYGDVDLTKVDVDGKVIESNIVSFKIYDENNNVVNFNVDEDQEIKTYIYDENGSYSKIIASKGKIELKKLPVGKYYLEELIAPTGYMI